MHTSTRTSSSQIFCPLRFVTIKHSLSNMTINVAGFVFFGVRVVFWGVGELAWNVIDTTTHT